MNFKKSNIKINLNKCTHKNSYFFHENAPKYCPDCNNYIDGGKIINTIKEKDTLSKERDIIIK
jgi:hypothetical protein